MKIFNYRKFLLSSLFLCAFTVTEYIEAAPPIFDVRTFDGYGNNAKNPTLGMAGNVQFRQTSKFKIFPYYTDGSNPDYAGYPDARIVSYTIGEELNPMTDSRNLTYISFFWGQFLTHDVVLTETNPAEPLPILVLQDDPTFVPGTSINMSRSIFKPGTGTSKQNPRMQLNNVTSFIDASVVYGSNETVASSLREYVGGRLKTSDDNLLPIVDGQFVAGDGRVNENPGLTSFQTLFMREHNRLAGIIQNQRPEWDDEMIYQAARKIVGAEMQAITFNEFLPSFGIKLPKYKGYNSREIPDMIIEFTTAVFRFGHSQLNSDLDLLFKDGTEEELDLADSLFGFSGFDSTLMGAILRGGSHAAAESIDIQLNDALRDSFIFGIFPFDLFAIDVQRGRDHGIPDYNTVRSIFGLKKVKTFEQITKNKDLAAKLQNLYGSVDRIDLFVGMLAEDHLKKKSVGPLLEALLITQWAKVRNGDRFWYQNDKAFDKKGVLGKLGFTIIWLENRLLSKIILDNTDVDRGEIQKNVFVLP